MSPKACYLRRQGPRGPPHRQGFVEEDLVVHVVDGGIDVGKIHAWARIARFADTLPEVRVPAAAPAGDFTKVACGVTGLVSVKVRPFSFGQEVRAIGHAAIVEMPVPSGCLSR